MEKQLGDVDLFGLDEFGAGGMLGIAAGAIGAGAAAAGAAAARRFGGPTVQKNAELIGLAAGVAVGGAMVAMPSTRSAGWTAIAAAVAGQGIRVLETFMAPAALSGVVINPTHAWMGAGQGLGLVDIQPTHAWMGAGDSGMPQLVGGRGLGAGNPGGMPQLVGATLGAASQHVQLLGGPALSDVAGNWGSTHFNKR